MQDRVMVKLRLSSDVGATARLNDSVSVRHG